MNCVGCANFEPKRKQTGVICRGCESGACVIIGGLLTQYRKCTDGHRYDEVKWDPFYGKVVE